MKKLLFVSFSLFFAGSIFAQQKELPPMFIQNKLVVHQTTAAENINPSVKLLSKTPKKTNSRAGGSRWYEYMTSVDTNMGGGTNIFTSPKGLRIWQDSTIKQVYTSGAATVNYSSYYNVLDPKAPIFNSTIYDGEIEIKAAENYTVDSVVVYGVYSRPKPLNPADTLIVSVVKGSAVTTSSYVLFYNPSKTGTPAMVTNGYVTGVGSDTSMSMATVIPDSLPGKTIMAINSSNTYILKRVLTNADTGTNIKAFLFALPTPLAGEANKLVGLSVTFKSGSTWIANVDTMSKQNNFMGIFSEENSGAAQEYRGNSPDNERNMSGCLFSTDRTGYYPSFFIEMWNSVAFDKELAWVGYKISCNSCGYVRTKDVEAIGINADIYPNPVSNVLNVNIKLDDAAKNVSIELLSTTGQLVNRVNVGSVNANVLSNTKINVAGLAKGMYLYSINADGKKYTNKLIIE